MTSIKTFLTLWEAIKYCHKLTNDRINYDEGNKDNSLRIEKELDGMFHVYDADK